MSEELLVRHCSPTLAGIKTGNMFPCSYSTVKELMEAIRWANRKLVPKGLRVIPLHYRDGRALIYVFRPKGVEKVLQDQQAISVLQKRGYKDLRVEPCICQLMGRFQEEGEFPHEVGLFLGYPPEDVNGFIENKACGQKCSGCWKVYGDPEAAQKTFAKYKQCTRIYCDMWKKGKSVDCLTVAS